MVPPGVGPRNRTVPPERMHPGWPPMPRVLTGPGPLVPWLANQPTSGGWPKALGLPRGNTVARGFAGREYHPRYSPRSPPGWHPPTLGARLRATLGGPRSRPVYTECSSHLYRFYRFFRFVVLVILPMATSYTTTCFFFRIRPPEESLHQKCRARRGEVDSSTQKAFGGF